MEYTDIMCQMVVPSPQEKVDYGVDRIIRLFPTCENMVIHQMAVSITNSAFYEIMLVFVVFQLRARTGQTDVRTAKQRARLVMRLSRTAAWHDDTILTDCKQ